MLGLCFHTEFQFFALCDCRLAMHVGMAVRVAMVGVCDVGWCGGGTLALANVRAQYGYTALTWAAYNGQAECARLLLDAGADKNATMVRQVCLRVGLAACDGGGDE